MWLRLRVLLVNLQGIYPPIGLGYLASSLEAASIPVEILDCGGMGYTRSQLLDIVARAISAKDPDLVGVGCYTPQVDLVEVVARRVKAVKGDSTVVLGGPHPTMDPLGSMNIPGVDLAVVGEGERTIVEVAKALEDGNDLSGIEGVVYREDGRVVQNPDRRPIDDLDEIPFPAYHLFPSFKLTLEIDAHGVMTRRHPYMPIITSRGCPFGCIYCHKVHGKSFRARSPENVIEEMKLLYHRYRVREFHVEDDCFNLDPERAKRFADLVVESGLNIALKFPNGLRADRIDEELIVKLKRAGTYSISLGVETASPRVMRMIGKSLDLQRVRDSVQLALKHGLQVRGFFMIGFPGETKDDIRQTIGFAQNLGIHFASFSIATPFPGTELERIARENGYIGERRPSQLPYANPMIETPDFTLEEVRELKRRAEEDFYSKPERVSELSNMKFSRGELVDYYSSPLLDYYHLLLLEHFSTYGSVSTYYVREDEYSKS
jgi:anaerobic magnesium-protoporphyrin IX monomethyl ester cyclase